MYRKFMILYLIVVLFSFGCSSENNNNDLKVRILNESIKISDSLIKDNFLTGDSFSGQVINFEFINKSKYNYFFLPFTNNMSQGSIRYNCFPESNKGLSLTNLKIYMEDMNKSLELKIPILHRYPDSQVNILNERFVKLGNKTIDLYKEDGYSEILKHMNAAAYLIIPAHSKLYFEIPIEIKYHSMNEEITSEFYEVEVYTNYASSLFFKADTTHIKKYLPESLVKTIEENNFKIFHGELESNRIPIELKK
ncbi:hypothetical protein [Neptunitalea lumnitzerae]|uniref:Lipoprotein n=1 Tax=Neptunitalea lumnitzerae TaxID=2965509 RepID=A0ABQ5MIN6_9FLAO|nr:hypothetical protein [Neptunitalea sp. Y10]GLB49268.1 hypothetical protein Y10_16360 [Neptunitalea sp. Y10]